MRSLAETFRSNVQARLAELSWKPADLAREMGTSPAFVSVYLSDNKKGRRTKAKVPGLDVLEKFARALRTTGAALLAEGQRPSHDDYAITECARRVSERARFWEMLTAAVDEERAAAKQAGDVGALERAIAKIVSIPKRG